MRTLKSRLARVLEIADRALERAEWCLSKAMEYRKIQHEHVANHYELKQIHVLVRRQDLFNKAVKLGLLANINGFACEMVLRYNVAFDMLWLTREAIDGQVQNTVALGRLSRARDDIPPVLIEDYERLCIEHEDAMDDPERDRWLHAERTMDHIRDGGE